MKKNRFQGPLTRTNNANSSHRLLFPSVLVGPIHLCIVMNDIFGRCHMSNSPTKTDLYNHTHRAFLRGIDGNCHSFTFFLFWATVCHHLIRWLVNLLAAFHGMFVNQHFMASLYIFYLYLSFHSFRRNCLLPWTPCYSPPWKWPPLCIACM